MCCSSWRVYPSKSIWWTETDHEGHLQDPGHATWGPATNGPEHNSVVPVWQKWGLGMAFWYPSLSSYSLWLSQFKVQATQTHHYCSSYCFSSSCSKHRIIFHLTWFLGKSCFTLQASFLLSGEKIPYTNGSCKTLWLTSVPLLSLKFLLIADAMVKQNPSSLSGTNPHTLAQYCDPSDPHTCGLQARTYIPMVL